MQCGADTSRSANAFENQISVRAVATWMTATRCADTSPTPNSIGPFLFGVARKFRFRISGSLIGCSGVMLDSASRVNSLPPIYGARSCHGELHYAIRRRGV